PFRQEKEFLCIHDNVDDLIESALNSKLLLINSNSQHHDKKEQEVKNVAEQPVEHISQIQDVVLRGKLLSIIHLIYNIESLNDNFTPDRVLNSFESDNSLLDIFRPNSKLFAIIRKRREVEEIAVMMNGKDKFDDDYQFFMFDKVFALLSAESEDTIFDPGLSPDD
nr:hypothetical protein [Tanacetum cinerariifolium]